MMFYSTTFPVGCAAVALLRSAANRGDFSLPLRGVSRLAMAILAVTLLVAQPMTPVWGAIVSGGDSDDPLAGVAVRIGIDSFGFLTIDDSILSNFFASVGDNDGGDGDVNVVGGTWNVQGISVGRLGTGALTITAGGTVLNSLDTQVGDDVGSSGTVIVNGVSSELVSGPSGSRDILIGGGGTGSLEITAGGRVRNNNGAIEGPGGSAIVSGPGSLWQNSGSVVVAGLGIGSLDINLGGAVQSNAGFIGLNGAVAVNGLDSLWNMTSDLGVNGSLSISGRGTVQNVRAGIDGLVSVSGGGLWNSSDNMAIGDVGSGQLDIVDNGIVVSANDAAVGNENGSTGTVNISDGGQWNVSGDAAIGFLAGSVGTANLRAGGLWEIGGQLFVGNNGSGTLNLAGGTVQTDRLSIAGSGTVNFNAGTLNIVGTGTSLTALTVGNSSGDTGTLQLSPGASVSISTLTLATDGALSLEGGTLTISTLLDMTAAGSKVQWGGGTLALAGGSVSAPSGLNLSAGGVLTGNGSVDGPVLGQATASITASGGMLTLGDAGSFLGFNYGGTLAVGAEQVDLRSLGYAKLGVLTTLSGGTLNATNGVALGIGNNLQGEGTINGRFTQASGSVIVATGMLTLGDATSVVGFVSDGVVDVNNKIVMLKDANEAVLNSAALVTLGSAGVGTLSAVNGLTLNFGGNITGSGTVDTPNDAATPLINNGNITGNSATQQITLTGYMKGVGTCDNCNIIGTDAPGFSTAAVNRGSVSYNGTLEIEIGGTTAGSGYDQLNHILGLGVAELGGTLELLLTDGFAPALGDMFQIISATGGVSGLFSTINGAYLGGGLGLDVIYGLNDVTLEVINVPLGDFNVDLGVDGSDFLKWQRGEIFNSPSASDLADWETNYGTIASLSAASTTVPEPATGIALLIGMMASLCSPRKRRRTT